ncbi:hypothetical protein E7X23_26810, partial [Bacteroides fragilis]
SMDNQPDVGETQGKRTPDDGMERNYRSAITRLPELQVWITNLMSEKLKAKGRRMMGWNEITGVQLHDY